MPHHGARRGSGKASRACSPPLQRGAPRTRSRRAKVLTTKSRERAAACQSRARGAVGSAMQNPSPTGGGIVLGCGVTLPKSIGRLRLSNRDPRAAPHIHHNFSIIKTISVGGGGGPVPENRPNRAVPKPDRR